MANGAKYWRLKYRFDGKEKLLALGVSPETTLKDARQKRDEARRLLANDIDPGEKKKADKRARIVAAQNSFEAVAREWHGVEAAEWTPRLTRTRPCRIGPPRKRNRAKPRYHRAYK